jgi:hypothetical protein
MAVRPGEDFLLQVQLAPVEPAEGVWVDVADMNRYSRRSNRDIARFPVFGRALPHSIPGTREQGFTVSGYLNHDDAGQARLRAAEAGNFPVNVRVLFDGTENGFEQEVYVASFTHDASPEGLQEHGFEMTANDSAVIVGTGPIV